MLKLSSLSDTLSTFGHANSNYFDFYVLEIFFYIVCRKKYCKLTLFMKNCFTFLRSLISRYSDGYL